MQRKSFSLHLFSGFFLAIAFSSILSAREAQIFGVCTHFGHGTRNLSKSLAFAQDNGFDSIRDEVLWSHVESEPGKFSLKLHHEFVAKSSHVGMKVLLVLGYGNDFYGPRVKPLTDVQMIHFKRYVRFVVSTFRSKVWGYEIWNEYDGKAGGYPPGSVGDYVDMVSQISPLIRELDPNAKILIGAMTPVSIENGWANRLINSVNLRLVDGFSIHPYAQGRSAKSQEVEYSVNLVKSFSDMLSKRAREIGVTPPRLYVTEMGWQTADGISDDEAGSKIRIFINSTRKISSVGGVWIYELENSGGNPRNGEHNYGVYKSGFGYRKYNLPANP